MAPNEQARKNHDVLFPGHVSTLAVSDPELIETFGRYNITGGTDLTVAAAKPDAFSQSKTAVGLSTAEIGRMTGSDGNCKGRGFEWYAWQGSNLRPSVPEYEIPTF